MSTTPTQSTPWQRPGGAFGSAAATTAHLPPRPPPPPPPPPESPDDDGPHRRHRQMLIFAGVAGAVLAFGLPIILIVMLPSHPNPFRSKESAPTSSRPPLAKACPAPPTGPRAGPARP